MVLQLSSFSYHTRLNNFRQGLQWNGVPKGIDTFTEYKDKIAAGEDTHPAKEGGAGFLPVAGVTS